MRTPLIAALFIGAASLTGAALAQTEPKPVAPDTVAVSPAEAATAPAVTAPTDAQSTASAAEIGVTRRAYRAACERHESHAFCDCVTAGMAQVLMPAEMRIAARTVGERINAQGDAPAAASTDTAPPGANSQERIETTEAHYAEVCAQYRR